MDDINHKYWAEIILRHLVHHIRDFEGGEKYITYGQLAREIGYPEPHIGNLFGNRIGRTLNVMGYLFNDMVIDGEKVPLIQALVVNQSQKLPSDGIKEFNHTYPDLSIEKKKDFVIREYQYIFEFGTRWETVLENLGLHRVKRGKVSFLFPSQRSRLHNPYGSEGSPEHVALRDFVARNPGLVGVDDTLEGKIEYPLKSGDSVDVVFETADEIVAVEIKSKRSGLDDIERGLFQSIKYQAVLEAETKIRGSQKKIRSLLVLQGTLPRNLWPVQRKLDIDVLENVSPNPE